MNLLPQYRLACMKYLRLYGLTDWHLAFRLEKLPDANASVTYDTGQNRCAVFKLDTKAATCGTTIDELAHHEVLELLLAELACMAGEVFSEATVNTELHKIIYAITNSVHHQD